MEKVGQHSLLIFVDLRGERPGFIDRIFLGAKFTSCMEGHSATRQFSSSML